MLTVTIEPVADCKIRLDKRQNVPFIVKSSCPGCGEMVAVDLTEDYYLSYPTIGAPTKIYFHHSPCDKPLGKPGYNYTEWELKARLDVTLTVDVDDPAAHDKK